MPLNPFQVNPHYDAVRLISDKSCFWNGPNFPPVVSHAMPAAD